MLKLLVTQTTRSPQSLIFSEGGLWGKLKQLGGEVKGLIDQLTGSAQPEPVPIPVRVER